MGYLGRRIGLSQEQGKSNPGAANGAVGGGLLDLFSNGYFERQGDLTVPPPPPETGLKATGGIISDYTSGSDVYRSHIFTSSGTFNVSALSTDPATLPDTVEYLVVAGGGGGGGASDSGSYAAGGGGGAGGLRTNLTGHPLAAAALPVTTSPGSYTVTIGAGGGGGGLTNAGGTPGTNGGLSLFGTIQSDGGGWGGAPYHPAATGGTGGSGGGSGTGPGGADRAGGVTQAVTSPVPWPGPSVQGTDGGDTTYYASGGGGGAGAQGEDVPAPPNAANLGGAGGIGTQVLITAAIGSTQAVGVPGPGGGTGWFAGGGGGGKGIANDDLAGGAGGSWNGSSVVSSGPYAGGGAGGSRSPNVGTSGGDGTYSTGGGGGGCGGDPNVATNRGGHGGSGIVVVRYKIASLTATAKATGGAISFYGGKTIHTFTTSGTFVTPASFNETCEVLVAAGGGGGAGGHGNSRYAGGGAGAGGVAYNPGTPINGAATRTVTIGSGGAGGFGSLSGALNHGQNGTPSYWGPGPAPLGITALGGGWGGGDQGPRGVDGGGGGTDSPGPVGSGGGGGDYYNGNPDGGAGGTASQPTQAQLSGTTNYGYAGGNGSASPIANWRRGGGGGGAGGAGATGSADANTTVAHGGIGIQIPTTFRDPDQVIGAPGPSGTYWIAGGGGGGATDASATVGEGGGAGGPFAGAGKGFTTPPQNPTTSSGTQNTGGGGGGGGGLIDSTPQADGGAGGSGLVLIAYPS